MSLIILERKREWGSGGGQGERDQETQRVHGFVVEKKREIIKFFF